jgi:crotonobetainyl-CoA:carnitine CoA-transferase CaiB-like acyl-CoA transferase
VEKVGHATPTVVCWSQTNQQRRRYTIRERCMAEKQSKYPLTGVRVIEMGVWHAGPGAGAIFGDLGAEVIKIETLDGDPERDHGGFGGLVGKALPARDKWNMLYEFSNRNKRSISVDVATGEGKAIVRSLVKEADLFLTNLRVPARCQLGVDYEALSAVNPRIVYLTVSAFGPKGPMAGWGGFDPLGQAVSGMMFTTGSSEPVLLSWIILDQLTAIAASHAGVTALLSRELHGEGQEVEVSLFSSGLWFQHANLLFTSLAGSVQLKWDRTAVSALRSTFPCKCGSWIVGTNHPPRRGWPQLCIALERPDLIDDPRFDTEPKRIQNKGELFPILDAQFRTKDRGEWLAIMSAADLLFAPVNTIKEVLEDDQALANGYIVDFDHRLLGKVKIPGYPAHFSKELAGTRTHAPELGEHTREVLEEIGYDDDRIAKLKEDAVINWRSFS